MFSTVLFLQNFYIFSNSMSLHCSKEGLKEHRSFFNEENIGLALLLTEYELVVCVGADDDGYGLPDNGKGFDDVNETP